MRKIEYRPRNLRRTLVELKDISEFAVDLAYAALLYDDRELASEVLDLEERATYLEYHARIALMLAAKNVGDAEELVGVFRVVDTAVGVASAAGDVARIVIEDLGLPDAFRAELPEAYETVVRVTLAADSPYAGRTLGEIDLQRKTGIRVTAIRRDQGWLFGPGADTRLQRNDVLVCSGPDEAIETVAERATGEEYTVPAADPEADIRGLDRAVETVIDLKNISEVAVGLAYSAALFDSDAIAQEVSALEAESDGLKDDLEGWVIDAVPRMDEPRQLRGLLHLATATEGICDAAFALAETVLRDIPLHPVFGEALRESAEVVTSVAVAEGSDLAGEPVVDLELETGTGMIVLGIHRETEWLFDPDPDTRIESGDRLVVRGPQAGERRLRSLAE